MAVHQTRVEAKQMVALLLMETDSEVKQSDENTGDEQRNHELEKLSSPQWALCTSSVNTLPPDST